MDSGYGYPMTYPAYPNGMYQIPHVQPYAIPYGLHPFPPYIQQHQQQQQQSRIPKNQNPSKKISQNNSNK